MKNTRTLTLASLFLAVMLILGYLEHQFPIPSVIPGIKLGLSNSALLLGLYWLGTPISLALMVCKVLLTGLITGSFASPAMWFALAGGTVSMICMILTRKIPGMSPIGVGIAGGVTHNIGQCIVAILFFGVPPRSFMLYTAILMVVGAVMGVMTGTLAMQLMSRLPSSLRPKEL